MVEHSNETTNIIRLIIIYIDIDIDIPIKYIQILESHIYSAH